ncbi:MAG: hypothetical protein BGO49_27165 [Planctomycetales bacterium 71-10]|nr:MAG: hypothetical protein BGO49_27165 [Planctomycetales bacterium 71-10]
MRHSAVYVRVSSRKQGERSQLPDLERWAKAQAEPVVWYRDQATGTNMDRPGWQSLERAINSGEVGRVVVWRLDRLGRTARGLTALFDDLQRRGVGLVSLREGIDLDTPAGRLICHVLASVAQYETEVRSERQLAGIAQAKIHGTKTGRPFGRPKGQGGERGKRLKVSPEKRAVILRLKAEGEKVARIARAVSLSRDTVYDVLRESADV